MCWKNKHRAGMGQRIGPKGEMNLFGGTHQAAAGCGSRIYLTCINCPAPAVLY